MNSLLYRIKQFGFEDAFQWAILISIPFRRIEPILLILILIASKWKYIPKYMPIAIALFVHAFVMCIILDYNILKPIQQIVLIGICGTAYYTFFTCKKERLGEIWNKYIKYCEFLGLLGIIEFSLARLVHIDPFNFLWSGNMGIDEMRVHVIFGESGILATFMVPYISYSILNFKQINKKYFYCGFFTFVMTYSAAGFFILFVISIYKLLTSKYKLLSWLFIPFFVIYAISQVSDFSEQNDNKNAASSATKIEQTFEAFTELDPYAFELLNLSTYATMTNFWVSLNAPSRLIGTGIGTHEQSYVRLYKSSFDLYGLNKEDAYSLFTRLFSEFGILGILALFVLIYKKLDRRNMINLSCFFLIISMFIRGGHYAAFGAMFFIMIFYISSKQNPKVKSIQNKHDKYE